MRILILGCTGMIGNAILKEASKLKKHHVYGTFRNLKKKKYLNYKNLIYFNVHKRSKLENIIKKLKPHLLINAIGITKHVQNKKKNIFEINSIFPHYAKKIANKNNCKFIQISTDCVFNGKKGDYMEVDKPNALDNYGVSKAKGEVVDEINLTVRTSTIGHEIVSKNGLLEWFLSQKNFCYGYKNAIFNGFPTYYFAKMLIFILLKKKKLTGIIHISGYKINKLNLLRKIKKVYKKNITIKSKTELKINRSLKNQKFKKIYKNISNWDLLLFKMKKNHDIDSLKRKTNKS